MLEAFGVPLKELSPRGRERIALVFLSLADLKPNDPWESTKDQSSGFRLKSRDIITYWNTHYAETMSRGSYDDIKRLEIDTLVPAGVVVPADHGSTANDPTSSYAIEPNFARLVRLYGKTGWAQNLSTHLSTLTTLEARIATLRKISRIPVIIPGGGKIELSPGLHNKLQRAIVEEFLPRFGHGSELLYLGDALERHLINRQGKLKELGFFEISTGNLPDIVAYSSSKNWIFLIEAVHSSGPISPLRKIALLENLKKCTAGIIFVTAFLTKEKFKQFVPELAWEQEIWIAEEPDHMVHFNGNKFLGPYGVDPD